MSHRKLTIAETYKILQNIARVQADMRDLQNKLESLGNHADWPANSTEQRLCFVGVNIAKANKQFDNINTILNG
jgi:hypothetical protein